MAVAGCIPVPVSTVAFHPREVRPVAAETALLPDGGTFSAPAFDTGGTVLAAYDSAADRVRIFRSVDLVAVDELQPTRRPRRLSFSPHANFLVIEAQQGWVADYLTGATPAGHIDISSPAAIRDDIQRAQIWDLRTGKTVPDLACDAATITEPQRGWLWASRWAITPGYRSSALLEAHFSANENEFSMLCWNGVQQRWDSRTWKRLADVPPPPFWDAAMRLTTAQWLTLNDVATRAANGRVVVLGLREKDAEFGTLYLWDQSATQTQNLPGECSRRIQTAYALSADARRIVEVCRKGLGNSLRAWDFEARQRIPLEHADFGVGSAPTIRGRGFAVSPDGRYLAAALLDLTEAIVVTPIPAPLAIARSDLRLWSLESGAELVSVPIDEPDAYADYFRGVDLAFAPDSGTLAVAGRRLRIYHMSDLAIPAR
jgi:hypothetical protein